MLSNVKAIPEGYHTVTPYLTLRDAAQAMEFYKSAFGARETFRMNTPEGKIGHAELTIGDSIVMLSDENPQGGCASPSSLKGTTVTLFLYVEDVDATFQQAVKAGATVLMPVTDMFWGDRHGQLADPFGHRWSIATHKEDLTPDQVAARARKAFATQPAKV